MPVYTGARFEDSIGDPDESRSLQAELVHALLDGPGIVVVKGAFGDLAAVDRVSDVFAR